MGDGYYQHARQTAKGLQFPAQQAARAASSDRHAMAKKRSRSPAAAESTAIPVGVAAQDWRAEQVREWLLLLLRFAVTRDARDESAVLSLAHELDSLGLGWVPAAPTFFRRTSSELCTAIAAPDDPSRQAVIKRHLARIDDVRLRQAFQAAIDREQGSRRAARKNPRRDLWAGLRR
jgi:hypothetical protein